MLEYEWVNNEHAEKEKYFPQNRNEQEMNAQ